MKKIIQNEIGNYEMAEQMKQITGGMKRESRMCKGN